MNNLIDVPAPRRLSVVLVGDDEMAAPSLKYVRIIVGHNQIYEVEKVTEEEKSEYWWSKPELRQMRNDYKEEIMMEGIRQLVKTRVEQEEDDPEIIEERVDEVRLPLENELAAAYAGHQEEKALRESERRCTRRKSALVLSLVKALGSLTNTKHAHVETIQNRFVCSIDISLIYGRRVGSCPRC